MHNINYIQAKKLTREIIEAEILWMLNNLESKSDEYWERVQKRTPTI